MDPHEVSPSPSSGPSAIMPVSPIEDHKVVTDHQNEPGFPHLLYTSLITLGFKLHPRFVGKEYNKSGTRSCVTSVHIDTGLDYPIV